MVDDLQVPQVPDVIGEMDLSLDVVISRMCFFFFFGGGGRDSQWIKDSHQTAAKMVVEVDTCIQSMHVLVTHSDPTP